MKTTAALLACCLLLAACGAERPPIDDPLARSAGAGGVALPAPPPVGPVLLVAGPQTGAAVELEAAAASTPGVAATASVVVTEQEVTGPDGPVELRVGSLDPLDLRPLTPGATREDEGVWASLLSGELVPTFQSAAALGAQDGGRLRLGGRSFDVGAIADNGVPNLVDVLIPADTAPGAARSGASLLVVGGKPGLEAQTLRHRLTRYIDGARVAALVPQLGAPTPIQVVGRNGMASGGIVGNMTFEPTGGGFIKPDKQWVRENIETISLPLIGEVSCHRLMVPQLRAALTEIEDEGLASLIDPAQYGGCYVPRFVDRNPELPLSMHAFGLAADLNVSTNQLGTSGAMDPRVVSIFKRWGFAWGGDFSRPDPMHFELARLINMP